MSRKLQRLTLPSMARMGNNGDFHTLLVKMEKAQVYPEAYVYNMMTFFINHTIQDRVLEGT